MSETKRVIDLMAALKESLANQVHLAGAAELEDPDIPPGWELEVWKGETGVWLWRVQGPDGYGAGGAAPREAQAAAFAKAHIQRRLSP